MSKRSKVLVASAIAVLLPVAAFYGRYVRTVVLSDLRRPQARTVSIGFHPTAMHWSVSGEIQGTGIVMVSYVLSNRFSGHFETNGRCDYYDPKASVSFVPDAPARGEVRAWLRFDDVFTENIR